jgi:hypothetical protein
MLVIAIDHSSTTGSMAKKSTYTCADYRQEMILLGLRRRLAQGSLSAEERRAILEEIRKLEAVLLSNR